MTDARDFLGRGFSFPPTVDLATGRFKTVSADEDIKQSIYIIITTHKNERMMLPDFGCNINDFVFELPDAETIGMIRSEITDALIQWEPRIVDIDVDLDYDDINNGKLIFDIKYTVRDTNNPNNLVFPYYLYEGIGEQ
ncbi:MAG: GPW/gp25 family protein [Oscillospiraceae bacterium]